MKLSPAERLECGVMHDRPLTLNKASGREHPMSILTGQRPSPSPFLRSLDRLMPILVILFGS